MTSRSGGSGSVVIGVECVERRSGTAVTEEVLLAPAREHGMGDEAEGLGRLRDVMIGGLMARLARRAE